MHTMNTTKNENAVMPLSKQKPWQKYFKENTESLVLPEKTIYGSLKATSQTVLDKPALHYYGAEITYREFLAKIDRYADAYTSMGFRQATLFLLSQ